MPEVTTRTRDDVAAAAIQDILKQEDYRPEFLKDLIKACRNANQTSPSPEAILINGKPHSVRSIREHLAKFVYMLPSDKRPTLDDDSLYNDSFLNYLSGIIDEVAGFAPKPPPANIPANLKEIVQIYQSAIEAKAKRENLPRSQINEYINKQITPIIIQTGIVKQAVKSQLGLVIDNSQYLENLAAALGRNPEVVKRLAKMRLDQIADKAITTQALIQARSISPDTSQLAALFAGNLQKDLDFDDLLGTAVRANKKDAKSAFESIKKTVTAETEKAKPAIAAAAKNLEEHPANRKTAQTDAAAAAKQVNPQLKPAKAARFNQQLARHQDNPSVQEKIIAKTFGVSASQAKIIRDQLAPQINQLSESSIKPNWLAMADPDSIFNDINLHPTRFPQPLVDAARSGRINDPGKLADAITISRNLNIPLEAVVLSQYGIDAQKLAARWQKGERFLGFIPMGHGASSKDPSIFKLSDLAAAQKQLAAALKSPPPLLPPQIPRQFQKTAAQNSRAVRLSDFFQNNLNVFRLPSAFSYNLGRIPPLGSIGNSGSSFVSGLRIESGPIDGIFNFMGSLGNTARNLPSFAARPFTAVGSAISNTIINPVKTWANTQIKSGLTRAGAWLAKKGVREAAKKLGMAILGKGTAALLAQAVPVVGQIAGVLTGLSALGDIGKFIWTNRKEIGFGLAGGFLLGQLLLGKLLGLLGSAAWTLGGAALGFAVGGPIGAAIGGTLGYLIGSGALGSILSGLGSALGSAAAGLSSFIGALTAPSLVAGLGSTVAAVGLLGVGAAWAIQTFFIQPKIKSALFVARDDGTPAPGGGYIPPDILGSCPIPNGFNLCGSLGSPYQTGCTGGHGSNEYWGGQGGDACRWGLPSSDGARCTTNPFPGSFCYDSTSICTDYGFASDFTYAGISKPERCGKPVYLVSLNGQTLDWAVVWTRDNLGGVGRSGLIRATDGTSVYEMYMTHLNDYPVGGRSGEITGTLYCSIATPHVHVELKIDGEYVRPDFLCEGSGNIINVTPTPAQPNEPGPGRR